MSKKVEIEVEGRPMLVSNLDKVFYPKTGFTKGEVIDYYIRIAPVMLPHIAGRPISLKRFPDGAEGEFFYEKQCPSHAPDWIKAKTKKVKKSDGSVIDYCVLDDLPALVWAANIANLEVHPFTHTRASLNRPTALVFDLDPGPPADIVDCCQVGIKIRDLFTALKLKCFAKTSGSKGLQIVVPLNTPVTYAKTKAFAKALAEMFAHRFPDQVVSLMKKDLREGKVFIDWSQNDDKKTTVAVYSMRAKDIPSVSTPVTWAEVQKAAAGPHGPGAAKAKAKGKGSKTAKEAAKKGPLVFEAEDVIKRVKKQGDLFAEVLTLKQTLPAFGVVPG